MSDIQVFNNPQFGSIRTAGTANNPMFCLSDICKVLELQTNKVKTRLNERGVTSIPTPTHNQFGAEVVQEMVYVNESNLYRVIMRSDKPQAEQFQDWVCGEVLPSIRKHGAYMTEATIEKVMNDPDSWIKLLQTLKEERQQRQLAESKAALLEEVTRVQAPKVEYFEQFMSAEHGETNAGIREVVKQAHIKSEKRFVCWMIDKQILFRQRKDRRLQPYANYAKCFDYNDVHDKTNDWSGKQLKFNPYGKLNIVKKFHDEHPEEFDNVEKLFNQ